MLGLKRSASARLNYVLEQIEIGNAPGARAYNNVLACSARDEAKQADIRIAERRTIGALDGVLVSIKSMLDIRGLTTSAGSATLQRRQPAVKDCEAVARLRTAGAVVIGTTQMTEFAFSAVGTNPNHYELSNPHCREVICGGSSSGAAVSVGEGLADIAIGSDTGGSLRIPAALCGLVGFKPTASRISRAGAFPLSPTLDCIGSIASSVRLCALADAVLAGGEASDALVHEPIESRLIVGRGRLFDLCEQPVVDAFEAAIEILRRSSVEVVEGSLEPILSDLAAIDQLGMFPPVELAATLTDLGINDLEQVDPNTRARIEAGRGVSAVDYIRMLRMRTMAVEAFEAGMDKNEVYLVPTVPILAPSLLSVRDAHQFHRTNGLLLRNPRVANLLDCPSISLPVPSTGLPVGMMLVGRRNSDRHFLSIARRVEQILAGGTPPDRHMIDAAMGR